MEQLMAAELAKLGLEATRQEQEKAALAAAEAKSKREQEEEAQRAAAAKAKLEEEEQAAAEEAAARAAAEEEAAEKRRVKEEQKAAKKAAKKKSKEAAAQPEPPPPPQPEAAPSLSAAQLSQLRESASRAAVAVESLRSELSAEKERANALQAQLQEVQAAKLLPLPSAEEAVPPPVINPTMLVKGLGRRRAPPGMAMRLLVLAERVAEAEERCQQASRRHQKLEKKREQQTDTTAASPPVRVRYKAVAACAIRKAVDKSSETVGELQVGEVIDVLSTEDAGPRVHAGRVRACVEFDRGWTNVTADNGQALLELVKDGDGTGSGAVATESQLLEESRASLERSAQLEPRRDWGPEPQFQPQSQPQPQAQLLRTTTPATPPPGWVEPELAPEPAPQPGIGAEPAREATWITGTDDEHAIVMVPEGAGTGDAVSLRLANGGTLWVVVPDFDQYGWRPTDGLRAGDEFEAALRPAQEPEPTSDVVLQSETKSGPSQRTAARKPEPDEPEPELELEPELEPGAKVGGRWKEVV